MHQSGGEVCLQSVVGKGTTVELFLPRTLARPVGAVVPETSTSRSAGMDSILVVDDNEDVRAIVSEQLRSLGYQVVEVDSGDAALALLVERDGGFDLVFSDVVMPGKVDGPELATIAGQRWPALPVLLTSGFSGEALDGPESGAASFRFLRKPYRKADLARAVRAAMASTSG